MATIPVHVQADALDEGWDDDAPAEEPPPPAPTPGVLSIARGGVALPTSVGRAEGPRTGERRTIDVRAPRVSRSTKESSHFRDNPGRPRRERDGAEPRVEGAPNAEPSPDRVRPELGPRRPTRELGLRKPIREPAERRAEERRAEQAARAKPPEDAKVESGSPPKREKRPARAAPPTPPPMEAIVAPPKAPSLDEELLLLGAKPVVVKAKAQKDKPKTAKEALQLRALAKRGRRGKKGGGPTTREEESADEALVDGDEADESTSPAAPKSKVKGKVKKTRPKPEPEAELEEEETPEPPRGLWARIKGLFSKG